MTISGNFCFPIFKQFSSPMARCKCSKCCNSKFLCSNQFLQMFWPIFRPSAWPSFQPISGKFSNRFCDQLSDQSSGECLANFPAKFSGQSFWPNCRRQVAASTLGPLWVGHGLWPAMTGQSWAKSRASHGRPIVGQLSANCRPIVGQSVN